MPGVDFNKLRREIRMEEVLTLLNFEPKTRSGSQWYGRCPVHHSDFRRPRSFSVNVHTGRYYCHQCHRYGNQLELWAAVTQLSPYHAAIDLCRALGKEVPWIRNW